MSASTIDRPYNEPRACDTMRHIVVVHAIWCNMPVCTADTIGTSCAASLIKVAVLYSTVLPLPRVLLMQVSKEYFKQLWPQTDTHGVYAWPTSGCGGWCGFAQPYVSYGRCTLA